MTLLQTRLRQAGNCIGPCACKRAQTADETDSPGRIEISAWNKVGVKENIDQAKKDPAWDVNI
jgi:hypothetical protein